MITKKNLIAIKILNTVQKHDLIGILIPQKIRRQVPSCNIETELTKVYFCI